MKIGSLPAVAMEQYNNNRVKVRKTEALPSVSDRVEISGASRLFSQALQAARETPEVRMDKVEAVRAQINSGTYQIDASAIAARLLSGVTGE